jgi:hypothetical protein
MLGGKGALTGGAVLSFLPFPVFMHVLVIHALVKLLLEGEEQMHEHHGKATAGHPKLTSFNVSRRNQQPRNTSMATGTGVKLHPCTKDGMISFAPCPRPCRCNLLEGANCHAAVVRKSAMMLKAAN